MGNMAAEFHSMRPRPCHEIFDVMHHAFGDSLGIWPPVRMADFEAFGRSIAKHAGHDAGGFAGSIRLVPDGAAPDASWPAVKDSGAG